MEATLRKLFAEVLNLDANTISINDDFFALGGNSVRAANLVELARRNDISLTSTSIYTSPILSDLAETLSDKQPDRIAKPTVPFIRLDDRTITWTLAEAAVACDISVLDIEDMYPATAAQIISIAPGQIAPEANRSRAVFRIPEGLDVESFKRAWKELIAREMMWRTRIVPTHEGIVQVVTKKGVEVAEKEEVQEYIVEDEKKAFGYGEPLVRGAVVDGMDFVCTAHHAVGDSRAVGNLMEKVCDIARMEVRRRPSLATSTLS